MKDLATLKAALDAALIHSSAVYGSSARMNRALEYIVGLESALEHAPHDGNCDSLLPGPDLGPSTKPCNCRRP